MCNLKYGRSHETSPQAKGKPLTGSEKLNGSEGWLEYSLVLNSNRLCHK